jgi:hypothetical protein
VPYFRTEEGGAFESSCVPKCSDSWLGIWKGPTPVGAGGRPLKGESHDHKGGAQEQRSRDVLDVPKDHNYSLHSKAMPCQRSA